MLSLVAATFTLWTPHRDTPRVPPVGVLNAAPASLDFVALGVLVFGCLATLRRPRRTTMRITAGALVLLMAVDQLRWQPWAYQALLFALLLTSLPAASAVRWARALFVSIYLWAAVAKLDVVFAGTLGQQILQVVAGWLSWDQSQLSPSARTALALAMPVTEAVVGLLLAWPRARRWGVGLACGLHLALVATLGPLGLGHRLGVLVWNAVSAAYAAALFWPRASVDREKPTPTEPASLWPARIGRLVVATAIAAPALSLWGLWDRWPAWGLYAPRGERAELYVHNRVADRLADEFGPSLPVAEPSDEGPWRRVELDAWVLTDCRAPRYPQNRVVVAMADGLAGRLGLGAYVRVNVATAANGRTGEREWTTIEGADALRRYADDQYWLNTRPRWTR